LAEDWYPSKDRILPALSDGKPKSHKRLLKHDRHRKRNGSSVIREGEAIGFNPLKERFHVGV